MPEISRDEVAHLATLARIDLDDADHDHELQASMEGHSADGHQFDGHHLVEDETLRGDH